MICGNSEISKTPMSYLVRHLYYQRFGSSGTIMVTVCLLLRNEHCNRYAYKNLTEFLSCIVIILCRCFTFYSCFSTF